MRQLTISMAQVYVCFLVTKLADDGTARRGSYKDFRGTVGDFFLLRSYTYVPRPLKKYKEYSCTLPTINILKDI